VSDGADVIVVGGGPAGSATAFALARSGVDVLVVDRARFPRDKPCSEYMSPQAARILADMGALDAIEQAGAAKLVGMRVMAPNGNVIHGEFASTHGFRGHRDFGLALRRVVLDEIILASARSAGATVREGMRVTDVRRDASGAVTGVRALDEGGKPISLGSRLVIGADGLRSIVARRLGVTRVSRWPRRVALVAHYRDVAGMSRVGEMHVDRAGYLGLADVGNGETNVALVVPAQDARELAGASEAFLERWIASRPALADRFRGAERVGGVRATGPFASRVRRAWSRGAAVVGDAADFFDPFTGEGIYAALRGGESLGYYAGQALLARHPRDADDALAAYDRWRRREFGGKWLVERMIGLSISWTPLLERAARTLSVDREMADLLVGVTGDFVPPREVLRPGYLGRLLLPIP
jgi:menaquinone-9 beta-reductase